MGVNCCNVEGECGVVGVSCSCVVFIDCGCYFLSLLGVFLDWVFVFCFGEILNYVLFVFLR